MKRETGNVVGIALAVAICAVWALAPSLTGSVLTNMDDDVYMAAAQQYGGLSASGIRWAFTETRPYYHPLPRITYLGTYPLCGTRPWGHHAVNLALHTFNSMLVVALAWALFRNAAAAGLTGLLFAVHPLQAESVAWMSGRTQLLCGGLMIGCALAYVRTAGTNSRWRWLPGVLFLLGWLAKPIVVTMPIVLLVLDWFPLRRYVAVGWRQLVREKFWMLAVGAFLTPLTFYFAAHDAMTPRSGILSLVDRALVAERAAVFYLWKMIWPAWLSPFYPLVGKISVVSADFYVPMFVLAGLCGAAWCMRRRCPAFSAAWVAYVVLLLPVSGLTQFGTQSVANRHAYVAILPLLFVIAGAVVSIYQRAQVAGRTGLTVAVAVAFVCLVDRTRMIAGMWHDDETLWRNVLIPYPDFAYANWKVAVAAAERQDFPAALPCAERAFKEYTGNPEVRGLTGLVYLKTGQYEEAAQTLQPLMQSDVWLPAARYNLACAYARLGSNDLAAAALTELVAREPRFAEYAKRDRDLAPLLRGTTP